MSDGNNIFKSISNLDRRVIYVVIFILVIYPTLFPIGIPISVSSSTRQFYDVLANIEDDDVIWAAWETGFSAFNELKGGYIATYREVIKSDAKIVVAFGTTEDLALFEQVFGNHKTGKRGILSDELEQYDYTYGEDYVVLGYVMVNEAAVSSLARDLQGLVSVDAYGDSLEGTFFTELEDAGDFDLIIDFSSAQMTGPIISHWVNDFHVPMIEGAVGVTISAMLPYLDSGHIQALLQSSTGCAELEYLTGHPGVGMTSMDALTLIHYFIVLLIILGNIGYFGWERNSKTNTRSTTQ